MDMRAMLREWEAAIGLSLPDRPGLPADEEFRDMRIRILKEEWNEYLAAEGANDLIEIADALADMDYIIHGTALHYGIDLDAVSAEVHRSNMAKVGPDGSVRRRGDGKILKPDGWTPPDIAGVLGLR